MHAFHSRADVARYLYWGPRDRAETRRALERNKACTALRVEGNRLVLAVCANGTRSVIGEVMLAWRSREHRQGEIGYLFNPDHHGRGYATEATRALCALGFDDLGLHRICGRCDARNTSSARLMERLGMRREAHLRHNEQVKGDWTDELVYAILEDEWRELASRRAP